jgi:hypothetical protein
MSYGGHKTFAKKYRSIQYVSIDLSTTRTGSGHKTFAKLFTCELAMPAACKSLFLCSQKIHWKDWRCLPHTDFGVV